MLSRALYKTCIVYYAKMQGGGTHTLTNMYYSIVDSFVEVFMSYRYNPLCSVIMVISLW